MRAFFLIPLLIIAFQSNGQQKFQVENGSIIIEDIREIPGKSKDQLFEGVKYWFAQRFNNSSEVITAESKDQGYITGNYIQAHKVQNGLNMDLNHRIQVDLKDGKYRVKISNMNNVNYGFPLEQYWLKKDDTFRPARVKDILQTEKDFNNLFENLFQSITGASHDDW